MSVMSKNVIPTLSKMASKSLRMMSSFIFICALGFPKIKKNAIFLKQRSSFGSMGILKMTHPQKHKDGGLLAYSDRKKVWASGALNLNLLKGFYDCNGIEIEAFGKRMNICITKKAGIVTILLSNQLQNSSALNEDETCKIIIVTLEDLLGKVLESLSIKPKIFNLFLQQISLKARIFSKDFCNLTEKPGSPTDSTTKDSQTSDCIADKISTKLAETCYKCLDWIKRKKFFDERRFGILENCDCMICYGCIRKADRKSNGVVKGPINCPVCSTESDNVVSSARWIEGKEKVKFFEEYFKNMLVVQPQRVTRLARAALPILPKKVACVPKPTQPSLPEKMTSVPETTPPSLPEWMTRVPKNFPREKMTYGMEDFLSFLPKKDVWTRGVPMVTVN